MDAAPSWLQKEPWFPVDAPLSTSALEMRRGRQFLLDVVHQFQVGTAKRYQKLPKPAPSTGHVTFCNIFLWDVTRALGCEIPHWVDAATKSRPAPVGYGNAELDANATGAWLAVHGGAYGWTECSRELAIAQAENGFPVVPAWINPTGDGHVAVCVPSGHDDRLFTAQAGGINFERALLEAGFGPHVPKLYTHR